MSEKEKISGKKLEQISGGADEEVRESMKRMFESKGFVTKRCQFCGKPFQLARVSLYYDGKDIDGHHNYSVSTCPECQEKYPFEDKKNWPPKINPLVAISKNIK